MQQRQAAAARQVNILLGGRPLREQYPKWLQESEGTKQQRKKQTYEPVQHAVLLVLFIIFLTQMFSDFV